MGVGIVGMIFYCDVGLVEFIVVLGLGWWVLVVFSVAVFCFVYWCLWLWLKINSSIGSNRIFNKKVVNRIMAVICFKVLLMMICDKFNILNLVVSIVVVMNSVGLICLKVVWMVSLVFFLKFFNVFWYFIKKCMVLFIIILMVMMVM